jgi:hypothetical protein
MDRQLPGNLIFEDSSLGISYDEEAKVNRTKYSIIIEGTRGGFLSLANAILFFSNDLEDNIHIHLLPFVVSDIQFTIECDYSLDEYDGSPERTQYGKVLQTGISQFVWKLSESEIDHVAASIHSLGHINPEIHFDEGKTLNEISVYCVVGK